MPNFYCNCLNVCILTDDLPSSASFLSRDNLTEDERNHEFFKQLPLIISPVEFKKEQPLLIEFEKIGSWNIYKCVNCLMYLYASSNVSNCVLMNTFLSQISAEEFQNIVSSSDYSSVFKILIMDYSTSKTVNLESNQVLGEYYNDKVLEMKRKLVDSIEKKKKSTEELIKKIVEEHQNSLKEYIARANNDFQIIKNLLSNRENNSKINSYENLSNQLEYDSTTMVNVSSKVFGDPVDNSIISELSDTEKNWDKDLSATDIPPSFDSEGLFPLDGMEENTILEDEDHSEDDLSDTDDSGSRDEGIHIPRRKSVAFARSLPIRVPNYFDPSFKFFDDRLDENKSKPNYKQNRNERPLDIPASIKALANSVHGDTIFGDLPRRKAGFRI